MNGESIFFRDNNRDREKNRDRNKGKEEEKREGETWYSVGSMLPWLQTRYLDFIV